MIVWSGRGYLTILVLFTTLFICVFTLPNDNANFGFIITAFVTGIFSWFFGRKWNTQNGRIVIDEKTGERLMLKKNHSLFWIPMQYWGIIFCILGIFILFQTSYLAFGVISSLILIAFIVIPLVKKNSSKPNPVNTAPTKTNK